MHIPNALDRGQDELVHHGAARLHDTHHSEGPVGVNVGLVCEAVGAEKRVSQGQARGFRHFRTECDVEGLVPPTAVCQFCPVVLHVAHVCADDAVAFVVVAVRQRDA